MKRCTHCGGTFELSAFATHKSGRDGYTRVSSRCKGCDKERLAEFRERTKREVDLLVDTAKKQGCVVCGEADPVVLQFHHIEQKDGDWSKYRHSVSRVKVELAKCVPLCANCHLRVHAGHATIPSSARRAYEN